MISRLSIVDSMITRTHGETIPIATMALQHRADHESSLAVSFTASFIWPSLDFCKFCRSLNTTSFGPTDLVRQATVGGQ
jgi:hypothetical protein